MEVLQHFAHSGMVPNVVAAAIGLPSAVLYLLQVLLVLRNRKQFNGSSFFQLFVLRAIPNLLNLVFSYLAPRFPFLGLFFPFYEWLPNIALNFFLFSSYYSFHVENVSTTMLALNRLTSILFPLSYDSIWRKFLPFSIAIIFLPPLVICLPIFQMEMRLYYHSSANTSFGFVNIKGHFPYADLNSYLCIAFTVFCCLLNIWAWAALRRHNAKFKQPKHQQTQAEANAVVNSSVAIEHQRIEHRLFIYSFCNFLCQSLMAAFYYAIYLSTLWGRSFYWADLLADALWFHYGLINDVCTVVVPAWLMVWSSSKMRQLLVSHWAVAPFCRRLAKIVLAKGKGCRVGPTAAANIGADAVQQQRTPTPKLVKKNNVILVKSADAVDK